MPDAPLTATSSPFAATGPAPAPTPAPTPDSSLKRLAVHGALWTILGFGARQFLRLGFNLVVTRLLYPELFGLLSLVYTITTGLALFCDVGIVPSVVRDPRGAEPAFLNTAWTLQIVRGFGIGLFCLLLAWPVSSFYGDHRLLWILPVIGLGSIVTGFNSTSLLTFRRTMDVRQQVVVDAGTQLLAGVVMIVWAWLSPTVWALIAGTLASAAIRMVWSHLLLSERSDRLAWEPAAVRALLSFGRWIWVASVLTFLASQVDRLILGKFLTWQMLGIYGLASAIAELPRGLAQSVNSNVIFPAYAKSADLSRTELRARILRHRWRLLLMMAVLVTGLAVFGDRIMLALYDKRYAAGAWMLPALAIGIWPSALANTIDSALLAIGRPHYGAAANLLKFLFTLIGIPIGFRLMGVTGAVIVVALNDFPYYAQIAYGLRREGLGSGAQDLKATAFLAAIGALSLIVRSAIGFGPMAHGPS